MPQPRTIIEEKFTTFIDFPTDSKGRCNSYGRWIADLKLVDHFREHKNYIGLPQNLSQKQSEVKCINYWIERIREPNLDPLALNHLVSLSEQAVFYAATTKYKKFSDYAQRNNLNFSVPELVYIIRDKFICHPKEFLVFDSTKSKFDSFIYLKADQTITNYLIEKEVQKKYSDAALLRTYKNKPNQLKEVLINYGIRDIDDSLIRTLIGNYGIRDVVDSYQLSRCYLAWHCFMERYTPTQEKDSRKLQWPNQKQLESIANRYNELLLMSESNSNSNSRSDRRLWSCITVLRTTSVNSQAIDESLKKCIIALRSDQSLRPPISLDVQNSDDNSTTQGDRIGTEDNRSPETDDSGELEIEDNEFPETDDLEGIRSQIEELEIEDNGISEIDNLERTRSQIKGQIIDYYNNFPDENKKIFRLSFGVGIIQEDIAYGFFGKDDQEIVSKKIKQKITTLLIGIRLGTTFREIAEFVKHTKHFLKTYIHDCFSFILRDEYLNQENDSKQLIQLCYFDNPRKTLHQAAERLKITEADAQEIIDHTKHQLRLTLSAAVQRDFPIPLDSITSDQKKLIVIDRVNTRISKFVDEWLEGKDFDA